MNKEQFLAKAFRRVYEDKSYAIGGEVVEVRLRSLNEAERTDYELAMQSGANIDFRKARRCLLAACMVDDDGKPMFAESELVEMDGGLAGQIYEDCQRLCNFHRGEVEALIKN